MKKYLSLVVLLAFFVSYSAYSAAAVDSAAARNKASISAMHPIQTLMSPGTVNNDALDVTGTLYPPCPGDPSNPTFPRQPICPDINGKWPAGITFNPDKRYAATSTYSRKINPANPSPYTNAQVYCPDACISTRHSTPDVPANISAPLLITEYQTAICPAGYAQITAFNMQPAVIWTEPATSALDYPIDSMSKYKQYVDAGYDCSEDVYISSSNYCTTAGTSSQWQKDYYVPYPQLFNFNAKTKSTGLTLINGYVGYYKDATDFGDCYYGAPADCSSPVPGKGGCPWPASGYLRKYKYEVYYKKCTRAQGYYYSNTAYAAASIVCSRVKTEYIPNN